MRHIAADPRLSWMILLLSALGVRLLGIASRPIWYDEAFSVLFSEKGLAGMLRGTLAPTAAGAADIHPLGYYSLLWLWMRVFGNSLPAVRMLSILAGLGIVTTAFLLGRHLFDERVARAAMLFAALAPFQVHYSQEIRMYALLAFWLMLATFAYMRGTTSSSRGWWAMFAICSALAQYTHNLAAFYLVCLAAMPLFQKDWKSVKAVAVSGLVALLLYLPWLIQLPAQLAKVQHAYWIDRPQPYRLLTLLMTYVTNLPLPTGWLFAGLFIALLSVSVGLLQTFRAVRREVKGSSNALRLLYLSFAPALLLFLFSQWNPVYLERALLPSGAVFCIWLAWALTASGLPRLAQNSLLSLLVLSTCIGIVGHVSYRGFPYGPYQALNDSLRARLQPEDLLLHSNKLTFLPSRYFDRDLPQTFLADPAGGATDTLARATQEVLGIQAAADIHAATAGRERVWFVIFRQSIEEYAAGPGQPPDLEFLESQFTLSSQEAWDDVLVYLFVRKP